MRPIVADRVAWSVGLSVTLVSPAKTAEPIEMPFGLRTQAVPRNYLLHGGPDSSMGRDNFEGETGAHCKVWGLSAVTCAKTAELIDLSFGLWTREAKGSTSSIVFPGGAWSLI